ncbi:MAG TPA: zinc-binding dehydrogenase [Methylomirabilota bacterium]|nr:zinc-binding dehydrogenase [Methylomirabilota bacterium]
MKAIRIHGHGGADKLRYEEAPEPKLFSPADAVVKLRAASLNRIDIVIRRGLNGNEASFPRILGADGAGVVVEVGGQAKNIKPGDPVCLYPASGCGGCEFCITDREFMCPRLRVFGESEDGTYAEVVRVPSRNCVPIPAGISFEEAAAIPLVYTTVWRMLITNAKLKPGEQVLIRGIGGGIASAALQVAVRLGAQTLVTSGDDDKLARAKQLGAAHCINDKTSDFAKEVRQVTAKRGVDVVVDCVGGEGWAKSLASLAKGGRLVTCGAMAGANPPTDVRRIFWNDLKIFGSSLGNREELRQVLSFIETSRAKPTIDQVFPLRDAATAQQRMESGEHFGKIVLRMA